MLTLKLWLAALLSAGLPFLGIIWLWKRKAKDTLDWALSASLVCTLSLLGFIATPWAMTSYYLRYLLIPALALAMYFSFRKLNREHPQKSSGWRYQLSLAIKAVGLLALLPLDVIAIGTYFYRVAPVELTFPLSGGAYYVIQGGNSFLANPFHRSDANDPHEMYAIDIVKLNWAGNRATGIYPQGLTSYSIYGATIYSPCEGEVIKLRDGTPENQIGDKGRNPGNYLVIRCKGVQVLLAHMTSGTFRVHEKELVKEGQPLARVGNAGHTSEPHLHVDAIKDSTDTSVVEPVPISFNGQILSTNSIVMR